MKIPLGRPRSRWGDDGIAWHGFAWLRVVTIGRYYERNFGFHEMGVGGGILDEMRKFQIPRVKVRP